MNGIMLVARQEFRTRLRTGRWQWLLGAWFVVIGLVAVLLRSVLAEEYEDRPGVPMFGSLLLFVLALTLLVAPALTAQSINGDRERGTLATLQITRLTPWEIALGKFAAGWLTGLVTLVLTLPFVAWPVLEGDVAPLAGLVSVLVVALLIGVVCALSLALSALVARGVTSTMLSYLTVFALMFGTLIAFGLAVPLVHDDSPDASDPDRADHVWWLLAPNPFVILADATPRLPAERRCEAAPSGDSSFCYWNDTGLDPLAEIGRAVRSIRTPYDPGYTEDRTDDSPVWPYGLAFTLLLAAASLTVTARSLRTPAPHLPKATRIA